MAQLPPRPSATRAAIFKAYEKASEPRYSKRLGVSILGEKCERKLWLGFRWAFPPTHFEGRILRLFETGQLEEERIIKNLESIGCTVDAVDSEGNQWVFTDESGHLVAKIDGAILGVLEAPKAWHLGEFKTANAKNFAKIVKQGCEKAQPRHFTQCQLGMKFAGLSRAVYIVRNKDNDDLYIERINYDPAFALKAEARGLSVVKAERAPKKISNSAEGWDCKYCDYKEACHGQAMPSDPNCRNCIHSTAIDGGQWRCEEFNQVLSHHECIAGCPAHLFHPDLIPYPQIDAGTEFISYKQLDGKTLINKIGGRFDVT